MITTIKHDHIFLIVHFRRKHGKWWFLKRLGSQLGIHPWKVIEFLGEYDDPAEKLKLIRNYVPFCFSDANSKLAKTSYKNFVFVIIWGENRSILEMAIYYIDGETPRRFRRSGVRKHCNISSKKLNVWHGTIIVLLRCS